MEPTAAEVVPPADPSPAVTEGLTPTAPEAPPPDPNIVVPEPAAAATTDPPVKPDGKRASEFSNPKCPAALAAFDQETVRLVNEKLTEVKEGEKEFDEANDKAKGLKKEWEALNMSLHKLIEERQAQRGKPVQRSLFDGVQAAEQPAAAELPTDAVVEVDPLEDLWKSYPLSGIVKFGARESDVQRLQDGALKNGEPFPCATMGALATYTSGGAPGYERRVADFRGIGPAGAERIGEATTNFWGWWNSGGKEEYANETGVGRARQTDAEWDQPGDGAATAEQSGVQGDGVQPGHDAAAGPVAGGEQPAADQLGEPGGDEPFVVPEGGGVEYSLAGGEGPEEGAVP